MIIRLNSDQVSVFWDLIRRGLIEANDIPREFQQDYSIHCLIKLHNGVYQAWLCYDINESGDKEIHAVGVTSILDEKFRGVKILNAEALFGLRPLTDKDINVIIKGLTDFAKANDCKVMSADYSIGRVREILTQMGFEEHRTVCRKFI